jgi:di/tricarboxylate transporter
MTRSKLLILLALAALAGAIALMPAPAGLSRSAQTVLAVTVFTAGLWLFQIFNNAVSTVLMMGLLVAVGVAPALALSGFSSPGFWILLVVLFYGFAMQRTGLAQRISFYVLSLFPATYPGILSASFFIGAALALGIPSMTVRTAIMLPIAWALTQALNLEPRSRGTALIVLTTVEMAVVPGCGLLYGSLFGPVVESVFRSRDLPLTARGTSGRFQAVAEIHAVGACAMNWSRNRLRRTPCSGQGSCRTRFSVVMNENAARGLP